MLENLKTDSSIEEENDVLGGNGPLDTDAYAMAIDMAYFDTAASGAISVNLTFTDATGRSVRQTIYVTSGTAKGGKNYYMVKKDGKETGEKRYLPGFNIANAIALLSVGKEIADVETEEKTINVWNSELRKEAPAKKQLLTELMGSEITLGLVKQIVDKNVKNPSTGMYEPSGETREENEIDKVFRTKDHLTVAEIRADATEAAFYDKWVAKNQGNTRNKAKGGGTQGTSGLPGAAPAADSAEKKPLFG